MEENNGEDLVKIIRNLNKENSKVDMEKIKKKERNWLENLRQKKLESPREKIKDEMSKKKRKLVSSSNKKINPNPKKIDSPDIRIAFKKITDKKKKRIDLEPEDSDES